MKTVEAMRRRLAREIASHAVVLARTPLDRDGSPPPLEKCFIGSGTLVQIEDEAARPQYGVLTCGHALDELYRPVEGMCSEAVSLMLAAHAQNPDGGRRPVTIRGVRDKAVSFGRRNRGPTGPDLAWLPLTQEHARVIQTDAHSAAVFHSLAKSQQRQRRYNQMRSRHKAQASNGPGAKEVHVAAGWNYEIHARRDGGRGDIWLNQVQLEKVFEANGWHYADYLIDDERWAEKTYLDGTKLPTSGRGSAEGRYGTCGNPNRKVSDTRRRSWECHSTSCHCQRGEPECSARTSSAGWFI